jgi:hypothetical protein
MSWPKGRTSTSRVRMISRLGSRYSPNTSMVAFRNQVLTLRRFRIRLVVGSVLIPVCYLDPTSYQVKSIQNKKPLNMFMICTVCM